MKRRLPKNFRLWVGTGLLAVISVAGLLLYHFTSSSPSTALGLIPTLTPSPTLPASPTPTPTPVQAASPLTGELVDASTTTQPVVGVMIENLYPDARPQSGLSQAGIVYEALAEGGITRFLALFQEPFPPQIGPIRSLRPYYLEWGLEHSIPVVHAGGSQPALAEIGPSELKNIDALAYGSPYFYRATDRLAPHNLYATASGLAAIDAKLKFNTSPTLTPLPRKKDAPESTPSHPTITIPFSSSEYTAKYVYNASSNTYNRFLGGVAHIDRNTTQQITVKNVVVQFVGTTYSTQPDGKPETDLADVGSGKALFFEDGGLVTGTWSKASAAAPTIFTDSGGNVATFNAGNTWISVVPTGTAVTY